MQLSFQKYEGTGNDFIILNGFISDFIPSSEQIVKLCDRRFGIGADGLMIIRKDRDTDFEMLYFNSDGAPGSMCGNGGRCMVKYAWRERLASAKCRFRAVDGIHDAEVLQEGSIISLQMKNVSEINLRPDGNWFADTGSPHIIKRVNNQNIDVVQEGRAIRYSDEFAAKGVNVNFVTVTDGKLLIRTYERGVEDETFSCGTGVTAASLVAHKAGWINDKSGVCQIDTKGGPLSVRFQPHGNGYNQVWLEGPAQKVFQGNIAL